MTTELIRRYRCDNCGREQEMLHHCNDTEWFPGEWEDCGDQFGLLCGECKGVALAALKTRERAEVQ